MFSQITWDLNAVANVGPWPPEVKKLHHKILKQYYSIGALRVLSTIFGLNKLDEDNTTERTFLSERYALLGSEFNMLRTIKTEIPLMNSPPICMCLTY